MGPGGQRQRKMAISHDKPEAPEGMQSRSHALHLAIGAIAIVSILGWLQFSQPSVCCGDFDGYYHITWSRQLWEGLRHGHLSPFTWLPLTTLDAAHYADQHLLYHLLLIPFTWFGNLRLAAKVGTLAFACAALLSLYWLILRYRIRYPWLWLLGLLACSWLFYVRLSMTRASGLSIVFIVAGIWLLFDRRYGWLGLAAFLYVWTYNLFVMLIVLVGLWAIIVYWSERKIEWRPFLWTCLGTIAGFVVHPYFPRNLHLFFEHLTAKSGSASMQSGVGFEWYSLPAWQMLDSAIVASAAMVVGYIAFGHALARRQKDSPHVQRALLFLLFSSFLLVITIRSVRFMEYWPPFAVLFAAFALQAMWGGPAEEEPVGREQQPEGAQLQPAAPWGFLLLAALLLAAALVYNLRMTRMTVTTATKDPEHYRAAAEWMRANIPAGALIYNINWSDFPKLFFYDTAHRYVSGLDPIYLQNRHPELALLNDRLSRREVRDPAEAIWTQFASVEPDGLSYVFVGDYPAPPPPEWMDYVMKSGEFAIIYRDQESVILQNLYRPGQANVSNVRQWDSPEQRQAVLPEVHRRFGKDVYATVEEDFQGGPALVIHNKKATAEWAQRLFVHDAESISGELLWQVGFHSYAVTDGEHVWAMEVRGNPKFRSAFSSPPSQPQK